MTPLGHWGSGLLLLWACPSSGRARTFWQAGWPLLLLAPDLDFLFPPHQGTTHSLAFCLVLGFFLSRAAPFLKAQSIWIPLFSHLLLDLLPLDPVPPFGIPLLWPLSLRSNLGLFPNIPRDVSFTPIQLLALAAEAFLLLLGWALYPKVSPSFEPRVQVSTSSNSA